MYVYIIITILYPKRKEKGSLSFVKACLFAIKQFMSSYFDSYNKNTLYAAVSKPSFLLWNTSAKANFLRALQMHKVNSQIKIMLYTNIFRK